MKRRLYGANGRNLPKVIIVELVYLLLWSHYPPDDLKRAIEELMRYLSDRRPKVAGALGALNITNAQAHEMPYLSAASIDDLFALPNAPLPSLTPEQLVRFSQIVDTALFKSYLIVRPGLLASLCRVANWCEVSEVEEVLRSREVGGTSILMPHPEFILPEIPRTHLSLQREADARESIESIETVRCFGILSW